MTTLRPCWIGGRPISGTSDNGFGVAGSSTNGIGVFGSSTNGTTLHTQRNAVVTWILSKGGGSFKIDHPLPGWFEALNRDYRHQLTPIGGPAPNLHIAA